ncbi:MAG: biopolymer transporter ExbD [Phycisphaerales bacterium]|nr:biopolymer transporter ExbD [Planctomycetota bacterium]MBL6996916.1 biopolymer transporter ExbD [Phycisphaerales bacterium]
MRPIRRTEHDARIEMMPLIDVIFLLLTFFIYAMVLMVRAEILPVPLESYVSGTPAEPRPSISITIGVDGNIYVNKTIVTLDTVVPTVSQVLESNPKAAIYLVVEDGEAVVDRGPLLTGTWDQLRQQGLEMFLVGAPKQKDVGENAP